MKRLQQDALPIPNPHDWLSVASAAAYLRVSSSYVYEMISDGRLTEYRIGTLRVIWGPEAERVKQALDLIKTSR